MTDRTPPGYRRTDPDETQGRLLYRQRAGAYAAAQLATVRRRVRLGPQVTGSKSDGE